MPRKIRDYKDEYKSYQGTEEQKKNRAKRNGARATAVASGKACKGDGKDIDHKKPLSKGGSNAASNTQSISKSANRSFARNAKGGIK